MKTAYSHLSGTNMKRSMSDESLPSEYRKDRRINHHSSIDDIELERDDSDEEGDDSSESSSSLSSDGESPQPRKSRRYRDAKLSSSSSGRERRDSDEKHRRKERSRERRRESSLSSSSSSSSNRRKADGERDRVDSPHVNARQGRMSKDSKDSIVRSKSQERESQALRGRPGRSLTLTDMPDFLQSNTGAADSPVSPSAGAKERRETEGRGKEREKEKEKEREREKESVEGHDGASTSESKTDQQQDGEKGEQKKKKKKPSSGRRRKSTPREKQLKASADLTSSSSSGSIKFSIRGGRKSARGTEKGEEGDKSKSSTSARPCFTVSQIAAFIYYRSVGNPVFGSYSGSILSYLKVTHLLASLNLFYLCLINLIKQNHY